MSTVGTVMDLALRRRVYSSARFTLSANAGRLPKLTAQQTVELLKQASLVPEEASEDEDDDDDDKEDEDCEDQSKKEAPVESPVESPARPFARFQAAAAAMRQAIHDSFHAKNVTDIFTASDWMNTDAIGFEVGELFWLLDTYDLDNLEESLSRGAGRQSLTCIAADIAQKLDKIYSKVSPKDMKFFVKALVPVEAQMAKLHVALQEQEELGEALVSVRSLLMRCIKQATPAIEQAAANACNASSVAIEAAKSAGKPPSQLGTDLGANAVNQARLMGLAALDQIMAACKAALLVGEDIDLRLKDLADLVAAAVASAVMASGEPIEARASLAERAAFAAAESHEGLARHFVQTTSAAARRYVEAQIAKDISAQKAAAASKQQASTRRQSRRHCRTTGIAESLAGLSHAHVHSESIQEGSDQKDEPMNLKGSTTSLASVATTDLSANGDGMPIDADIFSSCSDLAAGATTPSQQLTASGASLAQGELLPESASVGREASPDGISGPQVNGHLLHSQQSEILAQNSDTDFARNLVGSVSMDARAQGMQSDLAVSALSSQDILPACDMQLSPALAQSQLPQVPLPSRTSRSLSGPPPGIGAGPGGVGVRDGEGPRQSMLQGRLPSVDQKRFNWIKKLRPREIPYKPSTSIKAHRTLEDVVIWRGQHGYRHRQVPEGMEIMWSVYKKSAHPNFDQVPAGMEHLYEPAGLEHLCTERWKSGGPCGCALCARKRRLRSPLRTPRLPAVQT